MELGLTDEIIPEPLGGAHQDLGATTAALKQYLLRNLENLNAVAPADRLKQRYAKFRAHGHFQEKQPAAA